MNTGTVPRVLLAAACLVGLLGAVGVLSGALPSSSGSEPPPAPAGLSTPVAATGTPEGRRALVLAVADPVTLDVRFEDGRALRVRALGVQPPDDCYAVPAQRFAREALVGRAVTLAGDGRSDRFSRELAWVALPQGDYAVLAAEAGVVTVYPADAPPARLPEVRAAQDRAERAGRGTWGPPCTSTA